MSLAHVHPHAAVAKGELPRLGVGSVLPPAAKRLQVHHPVGYADLLVIQRKAKHGFLSTGSGRCRIVPPTGTKNPAEGEKQHATAERWFLLAKGRGSVYRCDSRRFLMSTPRQFF